MYAAQITTGVVVPISMSRPVPTEQMIVPANKIGNYDKTMLAQLARHPSGEIHSAQFSWQERQPK